MAFTRFCPGWQRKPRIFKVWFSRHFAATNGSPRKWRWKNSF